MKVLRQYAGAEKAEVLDPYVGAESDVEAEVLDRYAGAESDAEAWGDAALETEPVAEEVPESGADEEDELEHLVRRMLHVLGENPGRDGLLDTPSRVAKSLRWLTRGYS